jgi:hypothetical protein
MKLVAKIFSPLVAFLSRVFGLLIRLLFLILDQTLASIPSLIRAQIILDRKFSERLNSSILNTDPRLKISEQELKEYLELDITRLERIEDKAKSTVIGVALSVSLASPAILLLVQTDVFADETISLRVISATILILSIFFLLFSGYLALSGYKVGKVFLPQPSHNSKLIKTLEAKRNILNCIELNQIRVIQNANLLSASMDCLRNGLILVLAFLVSAVIFALV